MSHRRRLQFVLALLPAFISGCIEVPELDKAVPEWVNSADYPVLLPLGPDLLTQVTPTDQAAEIEQELIARSARLKTRAAALNAEVLSEAERDRLDKDLSN